ncbi:kinase-like domain-containing protein [Chaetomium sp. MPI-CAGE-AT-0009]|nr:kinase-like domain-containing protein [Chaetomium sp. MPI-CAGE-AT-0009]
MGGSMTVSTTSKSNSAPSPTGNTMTGRSRDSGSDHVFGDPFMYELVTEDGMYSYDTEPLAKYVQGGYHPVVLGDVLGEGGRFRVAHKLGYGGYATVWLCHDNVFKKWRAVKIMVAHASTADCPDMKALELFDGISPDVLAANGIQLPLEHFWIDGPNGRHLCFVLPLLGPKLLKVARTYSHVPELLKGICFQLVMAMKFIHSRDLCHGDFRPDNVLSRLVDGVDEWKEEAILKLLGEPSLARVEHIADGPIPIEPSVPRYLVEPAEITYRAGVCSSKIAVIDFGVSHPVSQPPAGGTGIPLPYISPEALFGRNDALGFHTDAWALGVTFVNVRCGFEPFADEYHDTADDALNKMERIMGPIPEPYRSIWRSWGEAFINCQDENGEPRDDDSWKDESVMATVATEDEEASRRTRVEERGRPNVLDFAMRGSCLMNIDNEEAADIALEAASNPGRLPGFGRGAPPCNHRYEKLVQYTIPEAEADQLFDLLLKIFRWQTTDRATLDQIADHEWFGDGNRQQRQAAAAAAAAAPACAPEPTPTSPESARSPSPQPPAKRSEGGVEGSGEEVHGSGIVKPAWESWGVCRGRVALGLRTGTSRAMGLLFWGLGKIGQTVSVAIIAMKGRDV